MKSAQVWWDCLEYREVEAASHTRDEILEECLFGVAVSFHALREGWEDFETLKCLAEMLKTVPGHPCVFPVYIAAFCSCLNLPFFHGDGASPP